MDLFEHRLLALEAGGTSLGPESYAGLDAVRSNGGAWFLRQVGDARLVGRGGGAFPAWLKWQGVLKQPGPRHVLVNGEEGEPAAWKDRYLLRRHPHLVLEGAAAAALAVEADKIWLYVSDETTAGVMREAAAIGAERLAGVAVEVVVVPHTYVAGDETAAVRFVSGAKALPHVKPPRPSRQGVGGQPTLVSNVETFAQAALIARRGAGYYAAVGTQASPGTFLATVSGSVPAPRLFEVPFGTPLAQIVQAAGADPKAVHGVLLGGYFSGFLPASLLSTPAANEELKPLGFGLGNGAIVVVGQDRCPVTVVADLFAFFAAESAGQCGPCVRGTQELREIGGDLKSGTATQAHLARLEHLGAMLMGRGACSLLDAAAMTATRALQHFAPVLAAHAGQPCADCAGMPLDAKGGYAVRDLESLLQ